MSRIAYTLARVRCFWQAGVGGQRGRVGAAAARGQHADGLLHPQGGAIGAGTSLIGLT